MVGSGWKGRGEGRQQEGRKRWEEGKRRLTSCFVLLLKGGTIDGWDGVEEILRRRRILVWALSEAGRSCGRGDGDLLEFLGSDDEGGTAPEVTLDEDDFVGEFLADERVRGEGGADDVEVWLAVWLR